MTADLEPAAGDWLAELGRELRISCPGLGLALDAGPGVLALGYLRVPFSQRGRGHAPRILRRILATADARGLDVVCTPTSQYGSSEDALIRALARGQLPAQPTRSHRAHDAAAAALRSHLNTRTTAGPVAQVTAGVAPSWRRRADVCLTSGPVREVTMDVPSSLTAPAGPVLWRYSVRLDRSLSTAAAEVGLWPYQVISDGGLHVDADPWVLHVALVEMAAAVPRGRWRSARLVATRRGDTARIAVPRRSGVALDVVAVDQLAAAAAAAHGGRLDVEPHGDGGSATVLYMPGASTRLPRQLPRQ